MSTKIFVDNKNISGPQPPGCDAQMPCMFPITAITRDPGDHPIVDIPLVVGKSYTLNLALPFANDSQGGTV
jgi:hypothetical protein